MAKLLMAMMALSIFRMISGQPQDDCLMKCMNDVYSKSPRLDVMKMIEVQPVTVGNTTAMCPKFNDSSKLETSCGVLRELFQCSDKCPDTDIKKMTMSAFRAPKFICIDRVEDIKKNMPCMSDKCPEVQRQCIPKCGSIEAASQRISDFMRQVRGGGSSAAAGAAAGAAPGRSTVPPAVPAGAGKDVDTNAIAKFIGETCKTMTCFMGCSEPLTTKLCGKDAYLLQRDLIWIMFSGLAQSMSSMGIQMQWPDECKPLSSAVANETQTGVGAGTTVIPESPAGTPQGTQPVATTTVASKTTKEPDLKSGKSTKAEGGSASMIASSSLFLSSIVVLILRNF